MNVSRGRFITEDHFSCVGWCKTFSAWRPLWDRRSRPFSVPLFPLNLAVYYKSKCAPRQWWDATLSTCLQKEIFKSACVYLLGCLISLSVCLLESSSISWPVWTVCVCDIERARQTIILLVCLSLSVTCSWYKIRKWLKLKGGGRTKVEVTNKGSRRGLLWFWETENRLRSKI